MPTQRSITVLSTASLALWLLLAGGTLADPPTQTDKPLPQVTVEAQRASLEHRLNNYVWGITRSAPRDESLRRWRDPICPLVAGLTREEGEFMLERLSQIARTAGAKLDNEHCARPNLVVVVTSNPDALIKGWGERRNAFGGVRGSAAKFTRLAARPRPVWVWYNHDFGGGADPTTTGSLQLGRAFSDTPSSGCCLGSHFDVKDVLVFTSVAVIVDGKQALGLQIGQLADYVAMVALTEIDLDAPLGTAPTILRLFAARAAGEQPPTGLSAWDQEFLKALYDPNAPLGSLTQRSVITGEMFHDLAP